jgi:aquaporin Z
MRIQQPEIMQTTAQTTETPARTALFALRMHWPEYLIEAAALGTFMVSACTFGALLNYPNSFIHRALPDALLRRALGGLAMGLTAVAIFLSPWGKRSGAHMNPAVTLSFLMLGKVERWDAAFYILFQFLGGLAGVILSSSVIGMPVRAVNYVATVPGPSGIAVAFWAELLISMLMMATVLTVSNSRRFSRYTPFFAATLVAIYITLESPLSGMSMNPARTFGSALPARQWTALWIYFTAPLAGMLLAATLYRARRGAQAVYCAKLHHCNNQPCIFRCRFGELHAQ